MKTLALHDNFAAGAACFFAALTTLAGQQPTETVRQEGRISSLESQIATDRKTIELQATEIQELRKALLEIRREVNSLKGESVTTAAQMPTVRSVGQSAATSVIPTAPSQPPSTSQIDRTVSPLSVRVGGVDFTPFGFVDLTGIWRSTGVGSGSGTAFGAIPSKPYPVPASVAAAGSNAALGALGGLPETLVSAQNSRFGLRVDTQYRDTRILGYIETDFVGAQPFDAVLTRSSNPLNVRLFFADLRRDKWEVLAGQAWSLITPGRVGISPAPADVFYTNNLDTAYQAGLVWTRRPQFRFVYHSHSAWSMAISLENPQQYIGKLVYFPPTLSTYGVQLNSSGTGFAQSNPNTSTVGQVPNSLPDVVAKAAYDGTIKGHRYHFEIAGVARRFAVVNPTNVQHFAVTGGGGSLNVNVQLFSRFNVYSNNFVSQGGGLLIGGLMPDVVARPNGSLSLVKADSTLDGFEYSIRNSLIYGYYGLVYGQRNARLCVPCGIQNSGGYDYGFGVQNNYGQNRVVSETTVGFAQTLWRNPFYGALQLNSQFSWVDRGTWNVTAGYPGTDPNVYRRATAFMVFLNVRYLIP